MDDNADGTLSLPEFRDRGRKPSERRAAPRGGRKHSSVSIRAAVAGWDVKSGTGYANRRFVRMDGDENGQVSFAKFVAYVK